MVYCREFCDGKNYSPLPHDLSTTAAVTVCKASWASPPPPHYHRGGGALDSSSVINGDHLDCCAVDEEPIDSPVTLAAILGGFPSTHDYYLFSCLYIIIIVSVYLANLALFCVRVLFLHKLV